MHFQQRDGDILQTIYHNDGVLAKRHIKALFWQGKSDRAMEKRLSKLQQAGFISWPGREHSRNHPVPEPICWLGWKGALFIAGSSGVVVRSPKSDNENQLRSLQKRLRDGGIRWLREPRWSMLRHDLAIVDFRISMERSAGQLPSLILENWIPESNFRSDIDRVSYSFKNRNGKTVTIERGVCPDAYFEIVDEARRMTGMLHRARFLLEMDMRTHDNPSFGREKVAAGIAYIRSSAYKNRFGANNGHWLVVTGGGMRRLENMMKQTEKKAGDDAVLFFFTTLDQINLTNLMDSQIWRQVGEEQPKSLLSG
jgi:hypothetical protein